MAKTYRAKFQPEAMFYAGNGDHGPIIDWLMASGAFKAGVSFDQKTGIYSVLFEAQRAMSEYVPPGFWIVRDKAKGFVAMCDYYFHETYEVADPLEALVADQQPLGEDIARIWDNNTGKLYEA